MSIKNLKRSSGTIPHHISSPQHIQKISRGHKLFPKQENRFATLKNLVERVFSLSLSHEPQELFFSEEFQVVCLKLQVLL